MEVTVADCERNQAAWNEAVALAGGGEVWHDGGLAWAWQPHNRQMMLNFPTAVEAAVARRGVQAARRRHARIIGAWLSRDVDPSGLEAAGFERGWEPWWMGAAVETIAPPDDPRITVGQDPLEDLSPEGAWQGVARVDGHVAGRAWVFVTGEIAGIYDMEVWPPFQRQGLGRGLLRILAAAARGAGARGLGLNATPHGSLVYGAEGLVRLGTGVTYWHHLR